jgi:hypothetical protein
LKNRTKKQLRDILVLNIFSASVPVDTSNATVYYVSHHLEVQNITIVFPQKAHTVYFYTSIEAAIVIDSIERIEFFLIDLLSAARYILGVQSWGMITLTSDFGG